MVGYNSRTRTNTIAMNAKSNYISRRMGESTATRKNAVRIMSISPRKNSMKVENMQSQHGRKSPNQFIIWEEGRGANGNFIKREVFQSYDSVIAERIVWSDRTDITLDKNYWDYSTTTGKYRNQFLGETIDETRRKIKDGTYILANLNK